MVLLCTSSAFADDEPPAFERVWPVFPAEDAVTDARPVFRVGFSGVEPDRARDMRFRIEMTPEDDAEDRPVEVWDQRERRSGWAPGGSTEIVFRPPRPLADGTWRWTVSAWTGVDWSPESAPRRLRVDTVPPDDVDGLQVELDRASGRLRLRWLPVTTDQDGGAEYVTRYHVYRFEVGPNQPLVRLFEIGTAEIPDFTDPRPPPDRTIVFYRIAAEDEAGNIPGVRR